MRLNTNLDISRCAQRISEEKCHGIERADLYSVAINCGYLAKQIEMNDVTCLEILVHFYNWV